MQRNFLFLFCFSGFKYCIGHIHIPDPKNIYIIHHVLDRTFRMGRCIFSDCISPRLKRMAKRCHCVDIAPIYLSFVWQERPSYRLTKRREHRLRCSRLCHSLFSCLVCCFTCRLGYTLAARPRSQKNALRSFLSRLIRCQAKIKRFLFL